MGNLGTIHYTTYDAAGKRTDVVRNGVLDTHHDCNAANQVLGPVDDVANNVISDTSRFAADADNC